MENTVKLSAPPKRKKKGKYDKSEVITSWLMLSPQIIGFLVFTLYPILWVYRYAFFDYDGVNATFIGLENFIRAFTRDSRYWMSILNTFIIAFGKLIVEFPLALALAMAVNTKIRGAAFFRVSFYIPCVISTAVAGLVFCYMFSSYGGPINNVLQSIGIIDEPVNWLGQKWTAMLVLMIASLWGGMPQNMLFMLCGLQGVPQELYEAAAIDGANSWQKFKYVTLPELMPVLKIILMLAMVNGMKMMDDVKVITDGGPAGQTEVVMLYIYKFFFETSGDIKQWGYASSLGAITSVITGIMTVIYLKGTAKTDN